MWARPGMNMSDRVTCQMLDVEKVHMFRGMINNILSMFCSDEMMMNSITAALLPASVSSHHSVECVEQVPDQGQLFQKWVVCLSLKASGGSHHRSEVCMFP